MTEPGWVNCTVWRFSAACCHLKCPILCLSRGAVAAWQPASLAVRAVQSMWTRPRLLEPRVSCSGFRATHPHLAAPVRGPAFDCMQPWLAAACRSIPAYPAPASFCMCHRLSYPRVPAKFRWGVYPGLAIARVFQSTTGGHAVCYSTHRLCDRGPIFKKLE